MSKHKVNEWFAPQNSMFAHALGFIFQQDKIRTQETDYYLVSHSLISYIFPCDFFSINNSEWSYT